jgi:hypothetical protein
MSIVSYRDGFCGRTDVKKSSDTTPLFETVRKFSPLLLAGLLYFILAYTMKLSFKIWMPVIFVATIAEAIFVLGQLYKPFLSDKSGKCIATRDSGKPTSMEKCRHYFPGSTYGGCGRREENGKCRLRFE